MGTRAQWDALAARLREATDPFQHPEVADLWALACAEAPRRLAKFRRAGRLDDDRIADLTRDLLVDALRSIINAANPQAYFIAALTNAALSWLRKGSSAVRSADEHEGARQSPHTTTAAPDHAFRIDVADFVQTLSQREYEALLGVAYGEERKELARRLRISPANLDQIVSRARRRFRQEEP